MAHHNGSNAWKLSKADVKKAIKGVEKPTWRELSRALDCHVFTIQRFLQNEKNKDLLELLEDRRGKIDIMAVNLIEDKIVDGDEKLALKWLEFKHKRENGEKVTVSGGLEIKISIDDAKKDE